MSEINLPPETSIIRALLNRSIGLGYDSISAKLAKLTLNAGSSFGTAWDIPATDFPRDDYCNLNSSIGSDTIILEIPARVLGNSIENIKTKAYASLKKLVEPYTSIIGVDPYIWSKEDYSEESLEVIPDSGKINIIATKVKALNKTMRLEVAEDYTKEDFVDGVLSDWLLYVVYKWHANCNLDLQALNYLSKSLSKMWDAPVTVIVDHLGFLQQYEEDGSVDGNGYAFIVEKKAPEEGVEA